MRDIAISQRHTFDYGRTDRLGRRTPHARDVLVHFSNMETNVQGRSFQVFKIALNPARLFDRAIATSITVQLL